MIVTRSGGSLRLVQQVEHGRVAGALAAAWGNEHFETPSPHKPVVLAATRHDEGWRARDAALLFHEVERRPMHFLEIDAGAHIRLYRRGLRDVSLADAYAGILVGMHWTGLYRGRWSAPGAAARVGRNGSDRSLQNRAVQAEQRRWVTAKDLAWSQDEPRGAFEARLWHNYELLQLWDLLSLYLAVMPQEPGVGGPPVPWGPQLRDLEHPPQDVLLHPVSPTLGQPTTRIRAAVRRHGEVTLEPFPFEGPVGVEVEQTVVPDRRWSRAEAFRRVRTTPGTTVAWRLVPAVPT